MKKAGSPDCSERSGSWIQYFFKQAKHAQNILTEQLAKQMQERGKEDILIMSAGPYKNCSCMSAYSVDAQKMADAVGMVCWADDSDVRFFYTDSIS